MMPTSIRKYLYERSLVDLIVDLFAATESLRWALVASGVLRKEEIRRVTETLPEEYQFVNERGIVNLLPKSLQRALDPFYNVGESIFKYRNRNFSCDDIAQTSQSVNVRYRALTALDVPALPPRPSEIGDQEEVLFPSSQPSRIVRGVQIAADDTVLVGESPENDMNDGEFFILPDGVGGRPPTSSASTVVPATILDANNTDSTAIAVGQLSRHQNYRPRIDGASRAPGIEEVIVDIVSKRAREVLVIGQRAAINTVNYVVTGGTMSDATLLSGAITFGVLGSMLSSYNISFPVSAAAIGIRETGQSVGEIPHNRSQLRESIGRVLLSRLLRPINSTLQSFSPVLYLMSVASGGMLAARLLDRYSVSTIVNRTILRPLYNAVQLCYARCLAYCLHFAETRHLQNGLWRAHIAAAVSTITVLVAWHTRRHWRQWQWFVAVVVARMQAKIAAQGASVAAYFGYR